MSDDEESTEAFRSMVRAEALDAVSDALGWWMLPDHWQRLNELLGAMERALATGEVGELAATTTELVLMGPPRIIRIQASPVQVPAPPEILEHLDVLVHVLGDVSSLPRSARGADGSSRP